MATLLVSNLKDVHIEHEVTLEKTYVSEAYVFLLYKSGPVA